MTMNRFLALILASGAAAAQTPNTVIGSSYTLPAAINAAPGQIMNLVVAGVGASLTDRVAASSLPLPDSLANISVQLTQVPASPSVAAPILAVRPISTCPLGAALGSAACGKYTVVTIQVPYELALVCLPPQECPVVSPVPPQLVVSENGVPGGAVQLNPQRDEIHVATSCDLDSAATAPCIPAPMVTHANGSLVTAASPAQIGEEISIYALGLGWTNPLAKTGQAAPSPALPLASPAGVEFNYAVNAPPSNGIPAPFATCAYGVTCPEPPVFAGLTPGSVGLYQVNVVVPPSQSVFPCGAGVVSNLTISVIGQNSFDGAGICVAPPPAGSQN
jgi:uncharacterized protein (TIGR03437 family)